MVCLQRSVCSKFELPMGQHFDDEWEDGMCTDLLLRNCINKVHALHIQTLKLQNFSLLSS